MPAMSRDLPKHFIEEKISPAAAVEPLTCTSTTQHLPFAQHCPDNPWLPKNLTASVPADLLSKVQWILYSEKPILQLLSQKGNYLCAFI